MALSDALATVTALRSEILLLKQPTTCPMPHFPAFVPPHAATLLSGAPSMAVMLQNLHVLYPHDRPVGLSHFDARTIIEHLLSLFDDSDEHAHANRMLFVDLFLKSFNFRALVTTASWDDLVANPPVPLPIPTTIGPVSPHFSRFFVKVPPICNIKFLSGQAVLYGPGKSDSALFRFNGPPPLVARYEEGLIISVAPGFEITTLHQRFFCHFSA